MGQAEKSLIRSQIEKWAKKTTASSIATDDDKK